jgi:phosphoglycerate-specific signal transduction histidine kinase
MLAKIRKLEARVAQVERDLRQFSRADDVIGHLQTLPGIGLLM